jgi:hypothetical protein
MKSARGLVISLAVMCLVGCDSRSSHEARSKRDTAAVEAEKERYRIAAEKKREDAQNAGVLATPPAWAIGLKPPRLDVSGLEDSFDLKPARVRYRVPPGESEPCLEYLVEGVAKRDMSFAFRGEDGDTYVAQGTRSIARNPYEAVFLDADGHVLRDIPAQDQGPHGGMSKGSIQYFAVRLTAEQARRPSLIGFRQKDLGVRQESQSHTPAP